MKSTITKKQKIFIDEICEELDIAVPKLETKVQAHNFIQDWIGEYNRSMNNRRIRDWDYDDAEFYGYSPDDYH